MNHRMLWEFMKQVSADDYNAWRQKEDSKDDLQAVWDLDITKILVKFLEDPSFPASSEVKGMIRCVSLLLSVSKRLDVTGEYARLGNPPICEDILRVREDIAPVVSGLPFGNDLLSTLSEMTCCYREGCYISVVSLGGKILEMCLKLRLVRAGVEYDASLGIGKLIGLLSKKCPDVYVDPGLNHLGNLINESRIPAVHAKEAVPVPSADQASMVVHAVLDTVRRTFAGKTNVGGER